MTKRDKQIGKREEHRPKARMDHCALMEVLYYALCGIPGVGRGELTEFPKMVRVMEGHEVFGPLQRRRIDWNQEMFEEEAVPETGKASSSGQPMEVDDESKKAEVVDAKKVTEEREEEADVEGAETLGTKRSRKVEDKEEGELALWEDVGGEETL